MNSCNDTDDRWDMLEDLINNTSHIHELLLDLAKKPRELSTLLTDVALFFHRCQLVSATSALHLKAGDAVMTGLYADEARRLHQKLNPQILKQAQQRLEFNDEDPSVD